MGRCYIDCRELPSVSGCSLRMSGEPEELERAAVMHALDVHQENDSPELREMIRQSMHRETGESYSHMPAPH